jgi:hypothetical protein
MKITLTFIAILLFIVTSNAQSQTISETEYNKVFQFAVSETNADYPLIFKVTTNFIENGKTVRTVIDLNENKAQGRYRMKRTVFADGKETNKHQITAGFGNVFCSDDGVLWKSSKYECYGPVNMYFGKEIDSIEYSFTEKIVDGKTLKVYTKYTVFAPSKAGKKKEFSEKTSTIDSRGFFVNIVESEGILDPKTVTLTREQAWTTKAKFKKIVPPNN